MPKDGTTSLGHKKKKKKKKENKSKNRYTLSNNSSSSVASYPIIILTLTLALHVSPFTIVTVDELDKWDAPLVSHKTNINVEEQPRGRTITKRNSKCIINMFQRLLCMTQANWIKLN